MRLSQITSPRICVRQGVTRGKFEKNGRGLDGRRCGAGEKASVCIDRRAASTRHSLGGLFTANLGRKLLTPLPKSSTDMVLRSAVMAVITSLKERGNRDQDPGGGKKRVGFKTKFPFCF